MINTTENQPKNMKPLKVLSLVLLALLLLVPAASAETYTIIDTDLVFSGGGDDVFEGVAGYIPLEDPSVFESENYVILDWAFSPEYFEERGIDISIYDGGTWSFGGRSGLITIQPDGSIYLDGLNPNDLEYRTFYASDMFSFEGWYCPSSDYYDEQWVYTPEDYAYYVCGLYIYPLVSGVSWDANYVITGLEGFEPGPVTLTPAGQLTQHVTVTYSDESEKYTVTLERNGIESSASIGATALGFLPLKDFVAFGQGVQTSSEDWTFTLPTHFLLFGVDYTFYVTIDGQTQSVSWGSSSLPESPPGTGSDPPGVPDNPNPEPYDPASPFPSISVGFSGILPQSIPTSLKDLFGFSKTEHKETISSELSIYKEPYLAFTALVDVPFDLLFYFITVLFGVVTVGVPYILEFLNEVIVWIGNSFFSFFDFLVIPNYILSVLVGFLPPEIVNLALLAFGFDILLNVFSILIPDVISTYKSSVHTYSLVLESEKHKSKSKGGKK